MAGIDYVTFFDLVKIPASATKKTADHVANIDASILHAMSTYEGDVDNSNELDNALTNYSRWQDSERQTAGNFNSELSAFLRTDGRNLIQSSQRTASNISADLKTFMVRDSETVLTNNIANAITFARNGDGIVSTITQDQGTRGDTITLSCITAQNGGDAVFSVRSKVFGNLTDTVTADGSTSYVNARLGIAALIVDPGSGGNEWVVSDTITIVTTSDDRSILMNIFRDLYSVVLPSSGTPTISNTFTDVVTTFPVSPEDGDEVVLNGVRYFFNESEDEWIESCL